MMRPRPRNENAARRRRSLVAVCATGCGQRRPRSSVRMQYNSQCATRRRCPSCMRPALRAVSRIAQAADLHLPPAGSTTSILIFIAGAPRSTSKASAGASAARTMICRHGLLQLASRSRTYDARIVASVFLSAVSLVLLCACAPRLTPYAGRNQGQADYG
jgi:hypothetical protein